MDVSKLRILLFPLFIGVCNSSVAFSQATPHMWTSLEYLYGWIQDSPIGIPLVTQNQNPLAFGRIGEPGTTIIFGSGSNNNAFQFNGMNGVRATIGSWLDKSDQYGVEAIGFGLAQSSSSFSASSVNGHIPIINIPFFSTNASFFSPFPTENVLVNRLPNTVTVGDTFQTYGVELNGLHNLHNQIPLILLAGFRYLNINEDLGLNDALRNSPPFPNSIVNVNDDFGTQNNFFGFQIGAILNYAYANFDFSATAKIALGDNYQKLMIHGQTNLNNRTLIQPIGLFAEPSNIGTFTNNQFAILPEVQARVGYNITQNIQPFVTYNCLYINNVIRPGAQIDRRVNQSQNPLLGGTGLSGAPAPTAQFNNSSMWMQSVSAGLEVTF